MAKEMQAEGIDLQAALVDLQTRLQRLRGEHGVQGLTTAENLQAIEADLQVATEQLAEADGDARLERDQSLLADIRDWTDLVASLHLGATAAIRAFANSVAEDQIAAWKKKLETIDGQASPEQLFDALSQTITLEFDLLGNEGRTREEVETLGDIRRSLREWLQGALPRSTPAEHERWATVVLDRCNTLLALLPELSPQQAIAYLNLVIDDVQWFLGNMPPLPGGPRRRLKHKRSRLLAERQERMLQSRLEGIFGTRAVALFERLILLLTFTVLGLIVVEGVLFPVYVPPWLIIADAAICGVFLWEFFFKLALVPDRWRWFRRHFVIDLLPAIPFGLLLGWEKVDPVRWGRLARLLRLSRLARYMRVIRILLRFLRFFGFLTRGLDRIARQYSRLLNRNIILYPNREERLRDYRHERGAAAQLRRLRAEVNERWEHLLLALPSDEQEEAAWARLAPLRAAYEKGWGRGDDVRGGPPHPLPLSPGGKGVRGEGDRTAEGLIRQLSRMSAHDIKLALGDDLASRLARFVRLLARAPFRWFPIIQSCVPRIDEHMTDADVLAEAAPRLASLLRHYHNRWFYVADLYGTISPSQFVDRLGLMLVKSAMRPAYRLTLFGLFLILTEALLQLTGLSVLEPVREFLYRFLGLPIIILGVICAFVVATGIWLQRLAKEATEYYESAVAAQFLALMENVRTRFLERDARIFYERVIHPERMLRGDHADAEGDKQLFMEKIRQSLLGKPCLRGDEALEVLDRAVLLHRDSLDGALLAESDTRTTSQLLGNPALRRFRAISARIGAREERALQRLNLGRQKTLFGGPYLWFNLITHSVAHMTARLIIDYNHNAIARNDLPNASPQERDRFEAWLRLPQSQHHPATEREKDEVRSPVMTTAFTAIHFLDDESECDREVAERFGPEVLERLRGDRMQLIRQVFGTYPLHRRPKEKRVLNLYAFYTSWLGGGRALFLPLFLLMRGIRSIGTLFRWIVQCIREIRRPEKRIDPADAADADFMTAVRKIDRMRGPIVYASMKLRARIDPEYLGVPLPGRDSSTIEHADLEADRKFLDLDPEFDRQLQRERERAEADMLRLARLINGGLLQRAAKHAGLDEGAFSSAEHVRAAASAYLADYEGIRELLSAQEILQEVYQAAATKQPLPARPWLHFKLGRMFAEYWRQHGFGDRHVHKAAWRATIHNVAGAARALRAWFQHRDQARTHGERLLADLLRHPRRITETLVTMRSVQTLAVLDVLNYREHVFRLGNYAAQGESRNELLEWGT